MRTKTLLLTAAVAVVGITASMAQTVYSVNAVGYVNITAKPGYNLFANPLNGTNNTINTVLPPSGLPDDCEVLTWNNGSQGFNQSVFTSGGGWYDQNGNPVTNNFSLPPGVGFYFKSLASTNIPLTFVGDVPQGNLTNVIGANFGFYGSVVPQSAGLSTMGFPVVIDMTYNTFHNNGPLPSQQGFDQAFYQVGLGVPGYPTGWADGGDNPNDPTPGVAQGFLISNPPGQPAKPWGRTFTVN